MKTLIIANHVVGLCRHALINFELIEAAVPHRELPEHITVVYVGNQHFWLSIPFAKYVEFMMDLTAGKLEPEVNPVSLQSFGFLTMFRCPTNPPGHAVTQWLKDHEAAKQAGQIRTKPVRYDPENSWRPGSGR